MAEWSNAAVLKTVEGHTSGGSNPSLSAKIKPAPVGAGFFIPTRPELVRKAGGNKKTKLRQQWVCFDQFSPSGITERLAR